MVQGLIFFRLSEKRKNSFEAEEGSMKITEVSVFLVILFAPATVIGGNEALLAKCLITVNTFTEEHPELYDFATSALFSTSTIPNSESRENMLALCLAFQEDQSAFLRGLRMMASLTPSQLTTNVEPRLSEAQGFAVTPFAAFLVQPGREFSWGEWVDINGDGLLDYVISAMFDDSHLYYLANFINTGSGWQMTDCQTNATPQQISNNYPYWPQCTKKGTIGNN